MQEKVIEKKQCKKCNSFFEITNKDLQFYDKISPIFNGKKYKISTPTLCVDCKHQRRLSFRNDKNLYKGKCSHSGDEIVSMYSPDKKCKVFNHDLWWSDKWEALDYGISFDFNKNFFSQYEELSLNVPHPNLVRISSKNADYSNYNAWNKNVYLCFAGNSLEDSLYCYNVEKSNNCVDNLNLNNCTITYESLNSFNSMKLFFSRNSNNCNNSYFLDNCDGCESCFMCFNLNNKKYYIKNKQYTKEEYKKFIDNINLGSYENLVKNITEFNKLSLQNIKKYTNNKNSQNCIGDYIIDSKNCFNCYFVNTGGEDIKNVLIGFPNLKDSYDITYSGADSAYLYEATGSGDNCNKCFFSIIIVNSSNIFYSDLCINCSYCFGCVSLKNKKYCILNKQYTKEEYNVLLPKIIKHMKKAGEWGEFFPSNISPFGYNETVANEYFPLKKEEAKKFNFKWSDYEISFPKVKKIIPACKLPDNIIDTPDDILNWAIECEQTKKPFKIIKQELDFYRKYNLPIPRKHPDIRHLDRIGLMNGRKIFDRKCDKCRDNIKTTYDPENNEKVYCEKCYNKEIY